MSPEKKEKLEEPTEQTNNELREKLKRQTEKTIKTIPDTLSKGKPEEYKELVGDLCNSDPVWR